MRLATSRPVSPVSRRGYSILHARDGEADPAEMERYLASEGPRTAAEALRLLRLRYPQSPLAQRLRVCRQFPTY